VTGYQPESVERQAALRRKADSGNGPDGKSPEHPLLTLQSQIGNAQVARLLAQRQASEEEEAQAKHDLSVQREGASEEDEVAAKHDVSLQRAASQEEDEVAAKHDLAQRDEDAERVGLDGGPVGSNTAQRIQSARGGGSALDSSTRHSMESGFGTSFEDVRIHHDSESDTLTRRLTSHAFTTGSDIFLRGDASPSDNRLLAHELTHVVQQRSMSGGGGMSVGAAGDPHEHQADATADAVLSQAAAPAQAAPAAQREASQEEDEAQASHDPSLQREASQEEDEAQASHDPSLQREADEDQSAD
jgi:uncharacterized protein DUF4157